MTTLSSLGLVCVVLVACWLLVYSIWNRVYIWEALAMSTVAALAVWWPESDVIAWVGLSIAAGLMVFGARSRRRR
jgi:hypothetical protein